MIALAAARVLLGSTWNVLKDHWKAVLFMLMFLVIVHYKSAYEDARQVYENHLVQDRVTANMTALKNRIVEVNSNKAIALEIKKHKDTIAKLHVNETELKQKVGDLYAIKTNADYRLASYHDRLLLKTGDSSASAESASDPQGIAECRRELDATDTRLSAVEEACAVTTSDYNLCRGWIDGVCANHQCTGEVSQ